MLLCVPQFMVILDATVVNVALPSIGRSLGFAATDLQWVVTAYVLMTGGLMLLGGRGADLLGRRVVFLTGLTLFTAASLASALAPTSAALIASRAGQGVGAAMLSPGALSIITATYEGAQRTTALSVWGALAGAGGGVGVLLGGILTSWLGWRSIFFINVPVGVITTALVIRALPADRRGARTLPGLDLPGGMSLIAGLALAVLAARESTSWGWGSARTLVLLAAAAALLATFFVVERRRPPARAGVGLANAVADLQRDDHARRNRDSGRHVLPRVPVHPARARGVADPDGLAFLPLVVVTGIASHVGRELIGRAGARATVVGGLALMAAGEFLLSGAGADVSYLTDLLPGFSLIGFGIGLAFSAITVAAMSEIGSETAGLASGLLTTGHELGAAFGASIVSAIAFGQGAANFVAGYGDGALAGTVIAAALALASLVAMPTTRSATGPQLAMH